MVRFNALDRLVENTSVPSWRPRLELRCKGHLNFFHQRMAQAHVAQRGEIIQRQLLPRLTVCLLAAMTQIDRARFVDPPEEHQRVRPLPRDEGFAGRDREGKIGVFERLLEHAGQFQRVR